MGRTGGGVPVAVKPKVIDPPGEIDRSKDVPVTVMVAPDWAKLAFQPLVNHDCTGEDNAAEHSSVCM